MARLLLLLSSFCALSDAIHEMASRNSSLLLESTYDLELLVTRHGLSCTNVAEKWISRADIGRRLIHDPLLSGAAERACAEVEKDVDAWLKKEGATIDAVLSSVLGRAIETALRTYPKFAKPVYIAPYIREHSSRFAQLSGEVSNAPKEQTEQLADLRHAVGKKAAVAVDYSWVNEFGSEGLDWQLFRSFLAEHFLPDLIKRLDKPPGSRITLAVVTHSNFMRDNEVGKKCGHHWAKRQETKALNNQVLKISYSYQRPADAAPVLHDKPEVECQEISAGMPLKDANGKLRPFLCLQDIGKCIEPLNKFSSWPATLWQATHEKAIVDGRAELKHANDQIIAAEHGSDYPSFYSNMLAAYNLTSLKAQANLQVEQAQKKIEEHSTANCWFHGHPDVLGGMFARKEEFKLEA